MPHTTLSDARTDPDLSGRRLGDYQLLRRLGRGGMAEVYLAEQISLKRQVAFKVLRGSLAGDDAYIRRFHHEAQAAAKLVHANIVQIHEVGCIDGIHFIAQEYVSGQNVKQLLARRGQGLDAPLAVSILRQVASALHKASEQGIIHRDIKPENIMLAQSGEVKVADFGLARVASQEAMNLTQVGITMGTPLYMSPEQVEGKPVDPRSDIYSLGISCYQMLAGHPPFDGETALAIAVQHLKNEPQRLEELRRDVPPALCRIIHKMLAKDPKERYQRPIEVLKDLRGLRIEGLEESLASESVALGLPDDTLTIGARMAATQQLERVLSQQMRRTPRQLHWSWKAAMVVAAFGLGAIGAQMTRPRPLLELPAGAIPAVKKCENVAQQYYYALYEAVDMERALLAVAEYFPPVDPKSGEVNAENQRYWRLSQQRLGRYYLSRDRLDKALAAYRDLATLAGEGELIPTYRITGLAGEAVVYDRMVQAAASRYERLEQEDPRRSEVKKRLTELGQEQNQELIRDEHLKQEVQKLLQSPAYLNQ